MQNFTFFNPTKIVFGKGTIGQVGEHAKTQDGRALLVYGCGSIKKNGVYDQVVESLDDARVERVEFSGVRPNPTVTHAREGIELAKREKIDFILAVGGGSVIDMGKAIAAGAVMRAIRGSIDRAIKQPDDGVPRIIENILFCMNHWDLYQYTEEVLLDILQRAQ